MKVKGNDIKQMPLVGSGRQQHPNNKKRQSKEPAPLVQLWVDVGLIPMCSDVSFSVGSKSCGGTSDGSWSSGEGVLTSSDASLMATETPASWGLEWTSDTSSGVLGFSTEVSDGQKMWKSTLCSLHNYHGGPHAPIWLLETDEIVHPTQLLCTRMATGN